MKADDAFPTLENDFADEDEEEQSSEENATAGQ
jgi:hypothetical protein